MRGSGECAPWNDRRGHRDGGIILVSSRIYPGDAPPFAGYIKLSGGQIVEMGSGTPPTRCGESFRIIDVGDHIVIPGLIDLHIHGFCGCDVTGSDPRTIPEMAKLLAHNGVTSFMPTLGAMPQTVIEEAIVRVKELTTSGEGSGGLQNEVQGAEILGLHLEGPFLNPEKKGAMVEDYLLEPSCELMARWLELGEGTIRRVTIAPELPGAREVITLLARAGVCVAAGHTMATYRQAVESFDWGVSAATHVYNAMREFHHREPGIVGAVLADPRVWAEVICDGIHVHPAALLLVFACKGSHKMYLVSDALAPAGLPPGKYGSLGQEITVDEHGRAYLANGALAGSTSTMLDGLKHVLLWTGRPLEDVLPMVTLNPARVAGVAERKGTLAPGKDADLVVLDDRFSVALSMVRGRVLGTCLNEIRIY